MTTRDPKPDEEAPRRRLARWRGLLVIALASVRTRAKTADRGRMLATVCIVALTVATLLLVTGVALALADDDPVEHDADLRIVPGEADVHSSVTGVEGGRLGESHDRAATIAERDGVAHATPVLAEPLRVENLERDRNEYILLVGIVPGSEPASVADLPTESLEAGDPHYANGSYDGSPTGTMSTSAIPSTSARAPITQSPTPSSASVRTTRGSWERRR